MQGKTISGYTLQRQLGIGGMAEVWLAENAIGKKAAVKILLLKFCNDEHIVARFQNEAKVMVQLEHPNIRQVYDYGSIDGRPCIVMEYLEGDDLKALMKKGQRFTDAELRKWWNQIADALNYTHAQGIVHRDIKPSNIFLDTKGNIKLLDFGIAKIRESISMTQTGAMMGTLMYMSPEQVEDSKHIGPESDIYSLAVTFVHLLTGKAPYDSTTSSDYAIRKGIVEIPLDLTGVPDDWQAFLRPYLEKDLAKRPALKHFEAAAAGSPSSGGFAIRPKGDGDLQSPAEDEGTLVNDAPKKQEPQRQEPKKTKPMARTEPKVEGGKPKSKKGLWIGLGAVVVAAIAAVLLWPRDPYKEIDQWLSESERIYDICLHHKLTSRGDTIQITDYSDDIAQMNIGFDYCNKASMALKGLDSLVPKWDSICAACDSLETCYVNKVSSFVNHELSYLNLVYDTAAVISRLRQLEEFNYIKMNVDDNGMLDRIEEKIGLLRNSTGSTNGHEWVDLGLPSGTLWATCNIGASTPEDYGSYYAWGETTTKSTYGWSTYQYANGSEDELTKYCNNSEYGNNGFTDNLTTLQMDDDAATVLWGGGWCTPSKEQWDELLENTTLQWMTRNGTDGRLFTSKKNGQTLFLPAAGRRWDSELYYAGSDGGYWSRSLRTDISNFAWSLYFNSGNCYMSYGYFRYSGRSVRPVRSAR